jgi:His/Glu/Gln/Arg/opine family amino acid ABC transporter permease subunit
MKKLTCRLAAVVMLLVLPSLQVSAQSALERVRRSGELKIGTDATYPPFEQAEGGKLEGFDIDLGRAIARELGVKATFVEFRFDGIFPALQNGNFDLVMSAVTITPERSQSLLFTDPYLDAGQLIAVRRETSGLEKPEDLRGKSVGVQMNTTAQYDFEKRDGVRVVKYNTIDLALLDLANKRIDAVVCDAPVLHWMISRGGSFQELKTVGRQFTDEKLGVALAQGSDDLRRAVNAALFSLRDKGEYNRIHQRWFGAAAIHAAEHATPTTNTGSFNLNLLRRTWSLFLNGARWTASLAFLALVLGLPLGLLLALARMQTLRVLSAAAAIYVEVMRGTPLLVQILFIYFVMPTLGLYLPAFTAGVVALTLNSAAYMAEIFRAGISSIEVGQMEAARSLGMTHAQAMRRIILPQTFRRVVPPLTNEGIALLKDSSLVSVIGLTELAQTGQQLASNYAAPLTFWPVIAVIYLLLTFPLTRAAQYLERRWQPLTQA